MEFADIRACGAWLPIGKPEFSQQSLERVRARFVLRVRKCCEGHEREQAAVGFPGADVLQE